MKKHMTIEIKLDEDINLYSVYVNGKVLLECMSGDEVSDLTIGELDELRLANY